MTHPRLEHLPPELLAQLRGLGTRHARASRAPRILVIGNVGNGNTGDEALLAVTLGALDPEADATVVTRNPADVRALHGVDAVAMRVADVLPALARCDAVVVVGGGMFGPGLPRLVRLLPPLVTAAARSGRDTAYVGIGVYPGMPDSTLRSLRRSASLGRGATVRDEASVALLAGAEGTPPPCIGDLALHLPAADPAAAGAVLRDAGLDDDGSPLLLLAPKASTTPDRTEVLVEALAAAATHWSSRGGRVATLAFATHTDHGIPPEQSDAALGARVAEAAGIDVPLVGPGLHPTLLKAVVGRADAVLGLRFHAVVFAAGLGVRTTSFAWEPKTTAFLAERGLSAVETVPDVLDWLDGCLNGGVRSGPERRAAP